MTDTAARSVTIPVNHRASIHSPGADRPLQVFFNNEAGARGWIEAHKKAGLVEGSRIRLVKLVEEVVLDEITLSPEQEQERKEDQEAQEAEKAGGGG